MVVILVEDLRGDVVGRAELLVEVTVRVVDERGAEVNDLNLVELLVLLKQDILWLQVTMHNVSLVAVVDAGEDLFHEDGTVALAELATLQNLIEELTTLADPKKKPRKCGLAKDHEGGQSEEWVTYSVTR